MSYTVDTLRFFKQKYPPPHELFFIIGGDWAARLGEWNGIDEIFSLAHFIAAKRPGYDVKHTPAAIRFLDFSPLDISATKIRDAFADGERRVPEVPETVQRFIRANHLYERTAKP